VLDGSADLVVTWNCDKKTPRPTPGSACPMGAGGLLRSLAGLLVIVSTKDARAVRHHAETTAPRSAPSSSGSGTVTLTKARHPSQMLGGQSGGSALLALVSPQRETRPAPWAHTVFFTGGKGLLRPHQPLARRLSFFTGGRSFGAAPVFFFLPRAAMLDFRRERHGCASSYFARSSASGSSSTANRSSWADGATVDDLLDAPGSPPRAARRPCAPP